AYAQYSPDVAPLIDIGAFNDPDTAGGLLEKLKLISYPEISGTVQPGQVGNIDSSGDNANLDICDHCLFGDRITDTDARGFTARKGTATVKMPGPGSPIATLTRHNIEPIGVDEAFNPLPDGATWCSPSVSAQVGAEPLNCADYA